MFFAALLTFSSALNFAAFFLSFLSTSLHPSYSNLQCKPNSGLIISGNTDLIVSETASISCSTDLRVESIAWLHERELISSVAGEQHLVLTFGHVSDSQHGRVYTCQSTASYGTQERNVTINVQGKWLWLTY